LRDTLGGYTDPDGLIYLVNRYYDPATGQFTSLDPEISMTGQPYTYANDNPVNAKDPNGLATLGVCLGAGVNLGLKVTKVLHLTAGGCLARAINTGSDDIGLTRTVAGGYGYGRGWWSVGTYYELSNAKKLQQLNGWFDFMGASAPFGGDIGFSAVYFWGGPIIGFDFGTTFGPSVNFVPRGLSYTWVSQFHCKSRWSPCEAGADFARGTWDLLVGGASYVLANIPFYLSVAKWVIQNRRR
jgi:RHS repeat-associated protein